VHRAPGRVATYGVLAVILAGLAVIGGVALRSSMAVPAPPASPAASTSSAAPAPLAAASVADPVSVTVPAIDAHSSLISLGLNADHTVEVPSLATPMQAGWYRGSSKPGAPGPAVLLGHVDSHGHPGIFYRLKQVKVGDQIRVDRSDGSTVTFVVTRTATVPKSAFPTEEVYGPTPGPTLRLITCGGELDAAHHNYLSSVIVWAELAA